MYITKYQYNRQALHRPFYLTRDFGPFVRQAFAYVRQHGVMRFFSKRTLSVGSEKAPTYSAHGLIRHPLLYHPPIPKSGPDKPQFSLILALFWDGGGIGEGTVEVYDLLDCHRSVSL